VLYLPAAMGAFILAPWCRWDTHSSEMLRRFQW